MEPYDVADFNKLAMMSHDEQTAYWNARIEKARIAEERKIEEIAAQHTRDKAARKLAAVQGTSATNVPGGTSAPQATMSRPTNNRDKDSSAKPAVPKASTAPASKSRSKAQLSVEIPRKVLCEACRKKRRYCIHDEQGNIDIVKASQLKSCEECRMKAIPCAHEDLWYSRQASNRGHETIQQKELKTTIDPALDTAMNEDSDSDAPLMARRDSAKTSVHSRRTSPKNNHSSSTAMDLDPKDDDAIIPTKKQRSNSYKDGSQKDVTMPELKPDEASHQAPSAPAISMYSFKIPKRSTTTSNESQRNLVNSQGQAMGIARSAQSGAFPSMQFSAAASSSGPVSTNTANAGPKFSDNVQAPAWTRNLSKRDQSQISQDRYRRSTFAALQTIRDDITRAENNRNRPKYQAALESIRNRLHTFEHMEGLEETIVRESKILNIDSSLPRLFRDRRDGFQFEFDVRADAKALWAKWCRTDFDPSIMRGILNDKGAGGNQSRKVDDDYQHKQGSNYFGAGDLVPGQWWPLQLCALRDGAHGSSQGGIYGIKDKGATSIILAGQHYDDKDNGNVIQYCGTKAEDGSKEMTDVTKLMHDNVRNKKPVRVIRSSKLGNKSDYTPQFGLRFDGVYDVLESRLLDASTHHYRFRLQRQPGQDPIRHEGLGARPTVQDIQKFQEHRLHQTDH